MSETMDKEGSAYLLSNVGGLEEAGRLRRQASMMLALELPALLEALPPGGIFLDLGCGAGLLADAVARARPDAKVVGVDADALAVSEASRVFGDQSNLRFHVRSLAQGPGADLPRADIVVMRLVLMHLPQPAECLRQVRAWLRPEGRLHIIEGDDRGVEFSPAVAWVQEVLDMMEHVQLARGGSRRRGSELGGLLVQAGWTLEGQRESVPDQALAAAAFGQVFLPVARFYLGEAVKLGLADVSTVEGLRQAMEKQMQMGFERIRIPLHHAWAS